MQTIHNIYNTITHAVTLAGQRSIELFTRAYNTSIYSGIYNFNFHGRYLQRGKSQRHTEYSLIQGVEHGMYAILSDN